MWEDLIRKKENAWGESMKGGKKRNSIKKERGRKRARRKGGIKEKPDARKAKPHGPRIKSKAGKRNWVTREPKNGDGGVREK